MMFTCLNIFFSHVSSIATVCFFSWCLGRSFEGKKTNEKFLHGLMTFEHFQGK